LAKATLLEPTLQAGGSFITLQGVLLEVGVETEISTHNGMMYMDAKDIKIEFNDSDFKDIHEAVLENMALKLHCDINEVKTTILPKKTITTKVKDTVKTTLKGVTAKVETPVEELIEEIVEETAEETPSEE
tara:strand:+ start:920 stop:1312 length:393 start_codon:yes stop_codon:yes gene_type:complete